MTLSKIPARHFERSGIFIGLLASATIVLQIHAEIQTEDPTSLSVWLTNGIAILAQITLLVVVMQK